MGIIVEKDDEFWMSKALDLAQQAKHQQEIPVGAIIVKDHKIIACAHNQSINSHDPCAHAEILALRLAGTALKNYRLLNTTLYVTLEPCCMCVGAMIHARISRLVYAAPDPKAGAAGSVYNLTTGFPLNHQIQVSNGILAEHSSNLLKDFFKERRGCSPSRRALKCAPQGERKITITTVSKCP